ncbi:MAG: ComEC family competence protein [Bacteroidales bacterium]|nr:ComEC family competence protein [Bacteroidales bacterium]
MKHPTASWRTQGHNYLSAKIIECHDFSGCSMWQMKIILKIHMKIIHEIRKTPFFRLIIPFIAGILYRIYFPYFINNAFYCLIIILSVTGIYKYFEDKSPNYHRRWISGILIFIALYFTGFVISNVHLQTNNQFAEYDLFTGKIIEIPKETEKSIKAILEINAIKTDSSWQNTKQKVITYFPKDSISKKLKYGDLLIINTRFRKVQNRGNPYEFDYVQYLASKNIHYQSYIKAGKWKRIAQNQGNYIYSLAYSVRNKLLIIYKEKGISGDEFSVLAALTLGVKDFLSDDITQAYSSSGAMHILAVSGLHVGIIYLIVNSLLFFMDKKRLLRILKSCLLISFIWFFAFITGLSPSVRRASLMLTLIIIGQVSVRHPSIYNSIAASAFLILLVNPLIILQVGFQLSYAAVIAIVYFQPKLYRIFEIKNWFIDKIWALTSVSIAAQIGTFPISIYYFHKFPVYFFLSNLIVIPAAYLIISLAIALLLFHSIGFLSDFFAFILKQVLFSLNYSTKMIESLPFSSINHISFSLFENIVLYLLVVVWIIYFINYKRKFAIFSSHVLLLIFFCSRTYRKIEAFKQNELLVFNSGNTPLLAIKQNKNLFLFADSNFIGSKNYQYLLNNYLTQRFIDEIYLMNDSLNFQKIFLKANFLKYNNLRILVINNNHFTDKINTRKLKVNLLIISKGFNANIQQIIDLFEFDEIILDAGLARWRENAIMRDCAAMNIAPFNVREQGAYILPVK